VPFEHACPRRSGDPEQDRDMETAEEELEVARREPCWRGLDEAGARRA
jgi:hypothetical protein